MAQHAGATHLQIRTHPVTQGSYFIATWPWAQVEQVLAGGRERSSADGCGMLGNALEGHRVTGSGSIDMMR